MTDSDNLVEILPPNRKRNTRKLVADAFVVARRNGASPEEAALATGTTLGDLSQPNRMKRLIAEKENEFGADDDELLKHVKLTLASMSIDGATEEQKFAATVALGKVLEGIAKRGVTAPVGTISAATLGVLDRVDE